MVVGVDLVLKIEDVLKVSARVKGVSSVSQVST